MENQDNLYHQFDLEMDLQEEYYLLHQQLHTQMIHHHHYHLYDQHQYFDCHLLLHPLRLLMKILNYYHL